jgi:hypothetical protein
MKINRENFEVYFLDYYEGQLSPEMIEEVKLFVAQNPDLRKSFDEFEAISLVADQNVVFEKKSALKKNQVFATAMVNELNYEEYLINEAEGLLNKEQLSAIEEFISINPQFEKDRKLYSLSHLSVVDDIVFEAKESLKKIAIPVGSIDAETFELFMAREMEGDLNPDEKLQLSEFMLCNPQLEKDRKLYAQTKLVAEKHILFEDKKSLKHFAVIPMRRVIYQALSAAASIALLFSMYFLLDRNNIPRIVAEHKTVKNIINQTITEPAIQVIPDKEVAINSNKNIEDANTPDKNGNVITNISATNSSAINVLANMSREPVTNMPMEIIPNRQARKISTRSYVDPQFTFIRESQMYMNENLELYYNLKLAQELDYAEMNSKNPNPAKSIFNALSGKASDLFASNNKTQPKAEPKNISLWTVAELGVKTFSSITSSDLELNLHKDHEGKVVGYGLESSLIDIDRDLKK